MTDDAGMRYVNGVFKGGGAKGVAYAGALEALEAEHVWFKSVAGASAGAITAALIAAGMRPGDIKDAVPDGLKAAGAGKSMRAVKAVLGQAQSIFGGEGLRTWIDATLRKQISKSAAGPVTFAELFAATRIELYVVVMDLSNSQPVVFCRRTTPDVEVAGAVVSSSAIPGAFPAGRGVFSTKDRGAVIHQFVDGGSWANYPSFVFEDNSFRTWLHHQANGRPDWDEAAWQEENGRPVVGLILGDPQPLEHRNPIGMVPMGRPSVSQRFDMGPSYTSEQRGSFIFGSILSSNGARFFITLALAIWVTMSVMTLPIGLRRFSSWLSWLPDVLYPAVLVVCVTVLIFAAVISIAVMLLLVAAGRLIADTLLPTMKAIMSVPTDVAPWIGMGNRSVVLRVPHPGLDTTVFNVKPDVRDGAVLEAKTRVTEQLRTEPLKSRLHGLLSGVEPVEALLAPVAETPDVPRLDHTSLVGLIVAAVLALVAGGLGWWVTNQVGTDGIGRVVVFLVVGFGCVGGALWYLSGRTEQRAAGRAKRGITADRVSGMRVAMVAIAVGVAAVVGGIITSTAAMHERAASTSVGRVAAASVVNGQNTYSVSVNGADVPISVSRHLRLGERVFVSSEGGQPHLVGALESGRFGLSLFLWIFGVGLITSGCKRRAWVLRCRRLSNLAAAWDGRAGIPPTMSGAR